MTAAVADQMVDGFRLTFHLPQTVKSVKYVKNHHYIELEDENGNKVRLVAMSLVLGKCQDCHQEVYAKSRVGQMACPHCVTGTVVWVWGAAQLAFVPEKESKFISTLPPPLADATMDIVSNEHEPND